jgi:hypothetical protein
MTTRRSPTTFSAALLAGAFALNGGAANAFSQIEGRGNEALERDGILTIPLPPLDPDRNGRAPDWGGAAAGDEPAGNERAPGDDPGLQGPPQPSTEQDRRDAEPLPVRYGADGLPEPVRDLRERLMEIARAGEIEALRPYLETGAFSTALSVVPFEGDPIEFLKDNSGDGEGVEILAIMLEVLASGHVRVDPQTENDIFVWPYFTQVALDELDKRQLVELFELVTAGDYQTMLEVGAYHFYRVGISPEGRLEFFLAGD